jgi:hypothetical protein
MRLSVGVTTFVVVCVLAAAGLILGPTAVASAAGSCSGQTLNWTGQGTPQFTDPTSWDGNAVPGPNDVAVISGPSDEVGVSQSLDVCELIFGSSQSADALTIAPGATITAGTLQLIGAGPGNGYSDLEGNIAAGSVEVTAGATDFSSPDSTTPVQLSASSFTLDPNANLLLASSIADLSVSEQASFGDGSTLDSNARNGDPTDSASARFNLGGALKLLGNVTSDGLELHTTRAASIDLAGHTWQMSGDGYSELAGGTTVGSSAPGGVLTIEGGSVLELDGTVTLTSPATLQLADSQDSDGTLSDSRVWTAQNGPPTGGNPGVLTGTGRFEWSAGMITGHVTLGAPLTVVADTADDKTVGAQSGSSYTALLLNRSTRFTLTAGKLYTEGSTDTFENAGRIVETGGAFGENSSAAGPLLNYPGASWTIAPAHGRTVGWWGSSKLTNRGTLVIAPDVRLRLNDLTQARSGLLQLTMGGRGASQHSSLVTAGVLKLGGTIELASAHGYSPNPTVGVASVIRSANKISGRFAQVKSVTSRRHTAWTLSYAADADRAVLVRTRH